jgi:hypothetical protein
MPQEADTRLVSTGQVHPCMDACQAHLQVHMPLCGSQHTLLAKKTHSWVLHQPLCLSARVW